MAEEQLVFAFHDETIFAFERAPVLSASHFGGPMPSEVIGIPHGPKPLHMVAELGSLHIPALSQYHVSSLPLVYGMYYDDAGLTYRVHSSHRIELLELRSPPSDDWPYLNFPPLLPFIPLRLSDVPRRRSYEAFAERFPNMREKQPAELIVAVPPLATIGLSLWGSGDGEGVTIVFECHLQDKVVRTYNVTS